MLGFRVGQLMCMLSEKVSGGEREREKVGYESLWGSGMRERVCGEGGREREKESSKGVEGKRGSL